jgi:hypothetical protein
VSVAIKINSRKEIEEQLGERELSATKPQKKVMKLRH